MPCSKPASFAKRQSATRATSPIRHHQNTISSTTSAWRRNWSRRRSHTGHQGYGGRLQPCRGAPACVDALKQEVGIPLHFHTHDTSGIRRRQRARCHRRRLRCGRWRHGCHERADVAAQLELDGRGVAARRPRPGLSRQIAARSVRLLGRRAAFLCAVRKRDSRRHGRYLPARDARRPVHESP